MCTHDINRTSADLMKILATGCKAAKRLRNLLAPLHVCASGMSAEGCNKDKEKYYEK